jgi:hypothetical protein
MCPDLPSRAQIVDEHRTLARKDALEAIDALARLEASARVLEDAPANAPEFTEQLAAYQDLSDGIARMVGRLRATIALLDERDRRLWREDHRP